MLLGGWSAQPIQWEGCPVGAHFLGDDLGWKNDVQDGKKRTNSGE